MMSQGRWLGAALCVAALVAGSCRGVSSNAAANTQKPTVDQIRALLADVGKAAEAGDDKTLHSFFERRPQPREFELFKSSKFWTLPMSKRVKRLGPDAFQINLSEPPKPAEGGFITMRLSFDLPVRWGSDGRLRILTHDEVERLEKLPVPDTPGGEPIVELGLPDEGSSLRDKNHFASEFWVTTAGDQTTFHVRFDPPLVTPDVRADRPTPSGASSFGGEISLEFQLDADGDPATGTRLDQTYQAAGGTWAEQAATYKDFGIDRVLKIDGKKNVGPDGVTAWVLDLELKTYTIAPERRGSDVWMSIGGDSLTKASQTDAGVRVENDVLTWTVPTAVAAVKPGGTYRVHLPSNSSVSSTEMLGIHRGKVAVP